LLGTRLSRGLGARQGWPGAVCRLLGLLLLCRRPCRQKARSEPPFPPADGTQPRRRIGASTALGWRLRSPGRAGLHGLRAPAIGVSQLRLPRLLSHGLSRTLRSRSSDTGLGVCRARASPAIAAGCRALRPTAHNRLPRPRNTVVDFAPGAATGLRTSASHARSEQIALGDVAPVIELTKELIGEHLG